MSGMKSRKRKESGAGVGVRKHGESTTTTDGGVELDMKKARFEIMKFAMNSLSGAAKHDAETALAISLGAKPPKPAYVNYRELQASRKKEKAERETQKSNYIKPKPPKVDSKIRGKKSVGHKLETTGIYKVKTPSTAKSNFRGSKSKGKARGSRR